MRPARSNSLFLAWRPVFAARFFSASICSYSDFGMVKLSRTSLCFFGFGPLDSPAGAGVLATTDAAGTAGTGLD